MAFKTKWPPLSGFPGGKTVPLGSSRPQGAGLAEQPKCEKKNPAVAGLFSCYLTDFIVSNKNYQFASRSGVEVILWMLKSAP